MAATPKYKVYNEAGEYVASVKDPNDAAVLLIVSHARGSVRLGHSKVLLTGAEATTESYDVTAELILERERLLRERAHTAGLAKRAAFEKWNATR